MDTPESPTQSPQSPEEEEKGLSDNELLESPESPAEVDKGVSDSELLNDDENEVQEGGGDSDFEDGDRVAAGREDPEDVSDLEDYKMDREEKEDVHQQDLRLTVRGSRKDASQSPEEEILETPRSPDPDSPGPEHERPFTPAEEERDEEDEATTKSGLSRAEIEEEDDEEEERRRRRRAAMVVSDLKDESSVSRDLDEHELDYDEEVPEEPSAAAPEEDEGEKGPAGEDGEDEEEDDEERGRRDSFRDKKKEEDDGEIDEGEIDDDDLEEGEVKDPMDRKIRPRPICRFFMKGNCTWGMICRFIHPGVNDKGNYSLISKPDPFSPNGAPPGGAGGGPHPLMPANPWGAPAVEELPPPPPPLDPPVESAWERGLRHAKEVLKKATIRKEQEPDFEEKRFTVTIGEDDRDFDKENDFFRERGYRITREIRDAGDIEFRDPSYGDPYGDPYYDYEMEAFWRGGQYENFRVQYTETPLPYYPVMSGSVSGSSYSGSSSRSRSRSSSASLSRSRSGSHKSRSLSVSSVSSVSSASSSSSSVRSADSDDMYADLASPVSSASSQSPTPGHARKERGPPRDKGPNKDRGTQQTDRGNRKRYFPADKERPPSPLSKRMALSPDRGRDRRMPGRPPLSPRMDRPKGQGPRPMPPQGERKRPVSPPPKSSGKGPAAVSAGKPPAPGAGSASSSGSGKPSSTLSRREELLKQLKAVEDAIARKRAKIPGK
uniref:Zinc finger CCCH-type containing 18 n=1 Tax=Cyprinus carpio carpio TaxID=630221 RepID=A0A9J8D5H4_CYPCA